MYLSLAAFISLPGGQAKGRRVPGPGSKQEAARHVVFSPNIVQFALSRPLVAPCRPPLVGWSILRAQTW